jgi:type II secretory pathway pseudopilin PulG
MQNPSCVKHNDSRPVRSGLSLIEVIAGIALLSTLLVSSMLAWSTHRLQIRRSQLQIEAAQLADQQLSLWYSERGALPVQKSGPLLNHDFLRWRIEPIDHDGSIPDGLQLTRFWVDDERDRHLFHVDLLTTDPGA